MQFRTLSSSVWVVVWGWAAWVLVTGGGLWHCGLVTCWVWVFTIFAFLRDSPRLALFAFPQAAPPKPAIVFVVTIIVGGLEGVSAWWVLGC